MTRALFDTAIFVYAVGAEHPYRAPCQELIRSSARDELQGVVSADLLQEFIHQRTRRTGQRALAIRQARDIPAACRVVDITAADALDALTLLEEHPRLDARGAVFATVALANGITHLLSPDRAFDAVPRLTRVDPLDADAIVALHRCGEDRLSCVLASGRVQRPNRPALP